MAVVDVIIRNNVHHIACNEGEEEDLRLLAETLSRRIDKLASNFAKANDSLLLIMAALMIEDELGELKRKQQQLPLNIRDDEAVKDENAVDEAVADALDAISEYVESLANKLDK